jgi:hypothetical protein
MRTGLEVEVVMGRSMVYYSIQTIRSLLNICVEGGKGQTIRSLLNICVEGGKVAVSL